MSEYVCFRIRFTSLATGPFSCQAHRDPLFSITHGRYITKPESSAISRKKLRRYAAARGNKQFPDSVDCRRSLRPRQFFSADRHNLADERWRKSDPWRME